MFQRSFNANSVVGNLIILNVLCFLATFVLGNMEVYYCEKYVTSMPVTHFHGGLFLPGSDWFKPWQLLTHMFLHGNFFHLLFNMYALWMFGNLLEQIWGPKKFLLYYFVCGFGAALIYIAVAYYRIQGLDELAVCLSLHNSVIGASGAVFGILLGFGMLFPNTELMMMFIPVPIKAKYFVIGYGALELFLGLSNNPDDNVAHFAHLGGMVFGFILIKIWGGTRNNFY
ncbi:MAG: rhomboid family intramembrane serine protease [Bacteroidota bacterium]